MDDNSFFKPTPLYKEFVILDLIEKNKKITQRMMSAYLNVSVSMINSYLDKYEEKGYIIRKYINSKIVKYIITKKGIVRKQMLNFDFLKASQNIYYIARESINTFLEKIIKIGHKKIFLYGAGEVAEVILYVLTNDFKNVIEVIGIIDDDLNKQSKTINRIPIVSSDLLIKEEYDLVLVSSYTNKEKIIKKLEILNIDKKKIIAFF